MADQEVPGIRLVVTRAEAQAAGIKRYFTGEPCRHGHVSERNTSDGKCVACLNARDALRYIQQNEKRRANNKASYARNHEARRAHHAAYYEENRAAIRAQQAAKNASNPEPSRARVKAWKAANPDRVKANSAKYRVRHADERRAYNKKWLAENVERKQYRRKEYTADNRDRIAAKNAKWRQENRSRVAETAKAWREANPEASRAIIRNRRARAKMSAGRHTKSDVLALFGKQKGRCANCRTSIQAKYHVDHVMPLALGGSNGPENLQLLCPPCNRSKGAKHPAEWARQMGRLV